MRSSIARSNVSMSTSMIKEPVAGVDRGADATALCAPSSKQIPAPIATVGRTVVELFQDHSDVRQSRIEATLRGVTPPS